MTYRDLLSEYTNYNELVGALKRGAIHESEIAKVYPSLRKRMMEQSKRIAKSNVSFMRGEAFTMKKWSEIVTTRDLVHEVASALKFYHSSYYKISDRREVLNATISKIQAKGLNVNKRNLNKFFEFMAWLRHSAYSALYDSDSEVTMDVFNEGSSPRQWEKLFREYANDEGLLE